MNTKDSDIRILVADDNEMMRNGLCSLLQSHPGWIICGEAVDGRDAVEKAINLRPAVILVDVSMPHLTDSRPQDASTRRYLRLKF